jgi:hypothetical protein
MRAAEPRVLDRPALRHRDAPHPGRGGGPQRLAGATGAQGRAGPQGLPGPTPLSLTGLVGYAYADTSVAGLFPGGSLAVYVPDYDSLHPLEVSLPVGSSSEVYLILYAEDANFGAVCQNVVVLIELRIGNGTPTLMPAGKVLAVPPNQFCDVPVSGMKGKPSRSPRSSSVGRISGGLLTSTIAATQFVSRHAFPAWCAPGPYRSGAASAKRAD